ncbi:ABC transporter ATP-binding protein [Sphingomonas baiyangensis]|uniref:ABC transporter ATP-binding protein n=1 Tax=Sphingomonas baiyangensis TaxID=2572576 RepID=A0A4U1LA45_9SPHN|nr:ABC transporter ATP-binding protein [Sphingomonas baiyangensis]TKD53290.1 ABC transporter ATP-binding protein [Sphingomonas baiyangensis]
MAELSATGIGVTADGQAIVSEADLRLAPGELVVLLGPNGAGKTSLLRAAIGLARPASGSATIGGRDVFATPPAERARMLAYLPQARALAWPQSVRDVVALGRFAHGAAPGRLGAADAAAVARAIDAADLAHLADRSTATLSGGEVARVHLARALAAEAPLIVADEPVASLDPRHQHRVMTLLRGFVAAGGGALVVLHDLDLAARHADRLVWMAGGRIVADGPPAATMTSDRIAAVYGVAARVLDTGAGRHVIVEGAL